MIRFTNSNTNKSVYVNPALISAIYVVSGGVSLYFDNNNYIHVNETEDEVVAKLYGAELDKYTRTGDYSRL